MFCSVSRFRENMLLQEIPATNGLGFQRLVLTISAKTVQNSKFKRNPLILIYTYYAL